MMLEWSTCPWRLNHPAQGLSEYGIPLAVVALVGFTAVPMFSTSIHQMLEAALGSNASNGGMTLKPLGSSSTKTSQALVKQATAALTKVSPGVISTTAALQTTTPGVLQIPANTAQAIETMGANGYTTVLSDYLLAYTQQLLQQGKITASQASNLIDLSNAGHAIAGAEAALTQLAQSANGDLSVFKSAKTSFNGQQMSGNDIAALINGGAFDPLTGGSPTAATLANYRPLDAYNVMQTGLLNQFVTVYQQAASSGALTDPTVNQLITNISLQIATVSEATSNSTMSMTGAWSTKVAGASIDTFSLHAAQAASSTTANSVVICATGSGTDVGTQCSGGGK